MKYEILINSIFRLPLQNSVKLFEDYEKDVGFKNFAEQQKVLDILTHKTNVQKSIKQEVFKKAAFTLCMMAKNKNVLSQAAFENIKGFPMVVWIEAIGLLDANEIFRRLITHRYWLEHNMELFGWKKSSVGYSSGGKEILPVSIYHELSSINCTKNGKPYKEEPEYSLIRRKK